MWPTYGCSVARLKTVARRLVVYLGDRAFRHEAGIEVLPFARFVEEVGSGLWVVIDVTPFSAKGLG